MTTPHLARLNAAFQRRIDIAVRWHGLKTQEAIAEFLLHDPDVAELMKDPEWQREALIEGIMQLLATDDVEACRRRYGREFVDAIFASRDRHLAIARLAEAAHRAHPDFVETPEGDFDYTGPGEMPSEDAVIEWFQINHPAQARAIEAETT